MGWVITSILSALAVIFLIYVIWISRKLFKLIFPDFKYWFRYKVRRKKFNEKEVEWCIEAVDKNLTTDQAKAYLILHGKSLKKANEMAYIMEEICKEVIK